MAANKSNILSCFGLKGGIGKSVFIMNLAGVCQNIKKKVLILDMDLYSGSIGIALNKPSEKTIYNFVDDYNNNRYKNVSDYITKYSEYIDFMACPKDPRKANKIDSGYVEILLDKVKYNYDLILIDMNHSLDEINLNILDKSDSIIFMVTNDIFDLKNMKSLISIFKDLEIDKYKVLLNQSNRDNRSYFNLYDIKTIIKTNIDYIISERMFVKNIDKYIMNGEIITLNNKYIDTNDYKVMERIINNNIGDKNE